MATITPSTGLGSGLNITEIVTALVQADTAAKQAQITRQTSNNTAYISGVGALRSALTAFTTAMSKLNDKTAPSFNAYAATSASETVVKATASNTAVAGTYNVEVKNLATSSKVASHSFSGGASTAIPAGELSISQNGKTYKLTVGDGATLQTVRDQINKELGATACRRTLSLARMVRVWYLARQQPGRGVIFLSAVLLSWKLMAPNRWRTMARVTSTRSPKTR